MKRRILAVGIHVCLISAVSGQNLSAKIKIDVDRRIGKIDSLIYGNFTEHLGRCIYGGIYDPGSPHANPSGFRNDVIEATKDLGVSVIRWPGGNFSSGYHWMDGIGPREHRPARMDLAWGDTESNQVGTDEFIQFSRACGVQPYLCVNLGTGTWDEAKNWVEYCNASPGLFYSNLRAAYGHPEPYHVKYWGLGNEIDGEWQMGHRSAEDYSKFALEAAKLMKWSDKTIQLIASGSSNYNSGWMDWNRTVLNTLYDQIDFISLHHYSGNGEKNHYGFMAITQNVEDIIKVTEHLIEEVRLRHHMEKPIYIAFDEYNVWYRAFVEQKLEEHYNLQDALVVAMYLNTFIRHANTVKMANMAQLVNVIAPMMVTNDKLWKQTIYYPLQLFSQHCHGYALDAWIKSSTYLNGPNQSVPYVDQSAVWNDSSRELVVNLVNRHADQPVSVSIENQTGQLSPSGEVYVINSNSLQDENSPNEQKVKVELHSLKNVNNSFTYLAPPHSVSMLILKMK